MTAPVSWRTNICNGSAATRKRSSGRGRNRSGSSRPAIMRKAAFSATACGLCTRRRWRSALTRFRGSSPASTSAVMTFATPARPNCAPEKISQIIELNGAASEAASIYDARNSLVVGLSHVVPAMGAGLRHRRGEPPARLCADDKLSHVWKTGGTTDAQAATYPGGGLNHVHRQLHCATARLSARHEPR